VGKGKAGALFPKRKKRKRGGGGLQPHGTDEPKVSRQKKGKRSRLSNPRGKMVSLFLEGARLDDGIGRTKSLLATRTRRAGSKGRKQRKGELRRELGEKKGTGTLSSSCEKGETSKTISLLKGRKSAPPRYKSGE